MSAPLHDCSFKAHQYPTALQDCSFKAHMYPTALQDWSFKAHPCPNALNDCSFKAHLDYLRLAEKRHSIVPGKAMTLNVMNKDIISCMKPACGHALYRWWPAAFAGTTNLIILKYTQLFPVPSLSTLASFQTHRLD